MLQPVRDVVGSVGGIQVRLPQVEHTKSIRTSSEWGTAWRKTVQATAVAFPHRSDELDRYGQYIDALFSSTAIIAHGRIILFDEAVRGLVGGGESCSFDKRETYEFLHNAFLSPTGVEANRGSMGRGRGDNREVCRRFNNKMGGCPNGTECQYRHICQQCGSDTHRRAGCARGQLEPSNQS